MTPGEMTPEIPEPSTRGGRQRLMFRPHRSDRSPRGLVRARDLIGMRRRQDSEIGQATTEFALILFPLLIIVGGILWFGIGLSYWLDMQRVANQGARWAAVNNWPPDCPRGTKNPANGGPGCLGSNTLQETLRRQILTSGLQSATTIEVCYPDLGSKTPGSPVKVHMEAPFTFVPILGIGTITLAANATMRLEQSQDPAKNGLITGDVVTC